MVSNGVPLDIRSFYNSNDPYRGLHAQGEIDHGQPYDQSANTDPLATAVLGIGT